jgi:hypothetical protein
MASLADMPELVGFFSYSRDDDEDSEGALTALRRRIQNELRAQLGRTGDTLRLWQDAEAIPPGTLWRSQIESAIEQAVFFVPIVTPRVINSQFCEVEFRRFLTREERLNRSDLVFPIIYIEVETLRNEPRWRDHPVLQMISERQYVDWSEFRHELESVKVRQLITGFCRTIVAALRRPIPEPSPKEAPPVAAPPDEAWIEAQQDERAVREEETARRAAEAAEQRQREARAAEAEREQREREAAEARRRAAEEEEQSRLENAPVSQGERLEHEPPLAGNGARENHQDRSDDTRPPEPSIAAAARLRRKSPARAAIEWGAVGALSFAVAAALGPIFVFKLGSSTFTAVFQGAFFGIAVSLVLILSRATPLAVLAAGGLAGSLRFLAVLVGVAMGFSPLAIVPGSLIGAIPYASFAIFEPRSRRWSVWLKIAAVIVVAAILTAVMTSATNPDVSRYVLVSLLGAVTRCIIFALLGHEIAARSR